MGGRCSARDAQDQKPRCQARGDQRGMLDDPVEGTGHGKMKAFLPQVTGTAVSKDKVQHQGHTGKRKG